VDTWKDGEWTLLKILFILTHYPPAIKAESTRAKLLIDELQERGNECFIVGQELHNSFFYKMYDKFERTTNLKYRLLLLPKKYYNVKNSIKANKPDVIVTWSTPVANHLIGYHLKIKYKLPWIVNMSDPWVDNPYQKYKFKYIKRFDTKNRDRCIRTADAIVMTTELQAERLYNEVGVSKSKMYVVPNYYKRTPIKEMAKKDKFTFAYAGTFYGVRTPEPIFRAINEARHIFSKNDVGFLFIGGLGKFTCMAKQYGIEDYVEVIDSIEHNKVAHIMKSCHALILTNSNLSPNIFMPLKVAEYMPLELPVLGIVPDGVTKKIIEETGIGITAHPDSTEEIVKAMQSIYKGLELKRNEKEIEKYNITTCAKQFEDVLRGVIK
jgi:glycosyltransferase involved in cell wall biosynthesis